MTERSLIPEAVGKGLTITEDEFDRLLTSSLENDS